MCSMYVFDLVRFCNTNFHTDGNKENITMKQRAKDL